MSTSRRIRSQHGVTLIEMLIVLALLAIVAGISSFAINSTWQRYRLEAAAGDVRSFVQQTFTAMTGAGAPVFLRLVPGTPNRLEIASVADGSVVLRQLELPELISLSMTSTAEIDCDWPAEDGTVPAASDTSTARVLQLDLVGRTLDATGIQVAGVRHLVMTHDDMVTGKLEPRMRYEVRLYPLWYVHLVRAKD
jgi:prepilin-type N-terminal cleavage/methylation domain-containing protein